MVERVKPKQLVPRVKRKSNPPPGIYSKAIQCKHCKHWYIHPCVDPGAELDCANYNFLMMKKKKNKPKS